MDTERFRALEAAAMEGAAQGLKALLLLNGGACVALLAFLGSTATSSSLRDEFVPLVSATAGSLIWFAAGAGVAVLACILAYWTNQAYANHIINPKNSWAKGSRLNAAASTFAIFSLACFGKGVADIAFSMP